MILDTFNITFIVQININASLYDSNGKLIGINNFLINAKKRNNNNNYRKNQKKLILAIRCQRTIKKIARNVII